MSAIAYFISPHGFGHASRAAAIMQAIQQQQPEIEFLVFTSVPDWFFADQGITNLHYHHCVHDVGLVQQTPFQEDLPATLSRLDQVYPYATNLVDQTVKQLKHKQVELVICDIAPLGLVAARQCGIPSVLIENFTWDWIYQPFVREFPQFESFIEHLQYLFPLADHHIQAEPICSRLTNVPKIYQPIARAFRTPPAEIRNQLGISEKEKMVLVSFGGNRDQTIQAEQFYPYEHKNTVFVIGGISDVIQRERNVIVLPHHSPFYHPDLVQAADIILAKAGYSTLAEVAVAGNPFAFISRENNIESRVLADYIHQHLPSLEISQGEFLSGNWTKRLPEILKLEPAASPQENGAGILAEYLLSIIS